MHAPETTPTSDTEALPRAPRLDRAAIAEILASGRRLLVQGGMGIHASDGLAGDRFGFSAGLGGDNLAVPGHLMA